MFRDYSGGLESDSDSIVSTTKDEIDSAEATSRERAEREGFEAGEYYAQDLHRAIEDGEMPQRLDSEEIAVAADRNSGRLWIKEKFEAIEADAGTRLAEHANALSERLMVIQTDLARWNSDLLETERDLRTAQERVNASAALPYLEQNQAAQFEAWKSEHEYDDLRYLIHQSTREKARIEERKESIARFLDLLPERIREVKEEVEAGFDSAVERGYRAKREELLHPGLGAGSFPGESRRGLWNRSKPWLAVAALVLLTLAGSSLLAAVVANRSSANDKAAVQPQTPAQVSPKTGVDTNVR